VENSTLVFRRRYALLLALFTAVLTDVMLCWVYSWLGFAADFKVFWLAARSSAPYAYSLFPFGSPPTALLLFQPLKLFPVWSGYAIWDLTTAALFLWSGSRLYGHRAAMLGAISPAIVTALIAGQVSLLAGAFVFAAFASAPLVCGALLGAAFCLKPQIVFLAPLLFFLTREFRQLGAFCVTVAVLALAATLACGPSIWSDWLAGMHNVLAVAKSRGALFLTVSPMAYHPWLGLLSAPLALWGLYLCRNLPDASRAAAVVAASLFAAPYAMMYDLAPLAVFAAARILRSSDWRSFGAAISYSAALGPFSVPFLWPSLSHAPEQLENDRHAGRGSLRRHLRRSASILATDPTPGRRSSGSATSST
jgi:hypothetical protein